ncbi:MAG: hypothetical protein LBT59_18620, partial [Clostridiales bacterium]|nr:hypothetical protein [Clostridiales bacterium]
MLHVWVGTCNCLNTHIDDLHFALFDDNWFDDPFIREMIEDLCEVRFVGDRTVEYIEKFDS